MELRYALRNLMRHRIRTAITISAVAFAVGLVVMGDCFMTGLGEYTLTEFTRLTGHVEVRNVDYQKKARFRPLEYNVAGYSALREKLLKVEGVKAVLGRIEFGALVQYTDTSTIVPEDKVVDESTLTDEQIFGRQKAEFAPAMGIEPALERSQNKLAERIREGEFFSDDPVAQRKQIVIGLELARRLGAKVGDELQLVSFRKGVMDAGATIVGIVDTGSKIENRLCYIPLATAAELTDLPDRVTQVQVFGEHFRKAGKLLEAMTAAGAVDGLSARLWRDVGFTKAFVSILDALIAFLFGAIVLVAVVGLLNTMLMTVLERQKEIGVLMALGVRRGRVIRAFLLEAIIFGGTGSLLGAIGGVLGAIPMMTQGIHFDAQNMRDLPIAFNPTVKGILTPETVFWALLTGFVVAVLGALWPAQRASAVNPIDAMRSN